MNQDIIKIIFSILIGLALASLFQRTCKGRSCIVYRAPNYNEIKDQTFIRDGKCFVYSKEHTSCASK